MSPKTAANQQFLLLMVKPEIRDSLTSWGLVVYPTILLSFDIFLKWLFGISEPSTKTTLFAKKEYLNKTCPPPSPPSGSPRPVPQCFFGASLQVRLGGELTFTATEWKDGPCLHIAGDLLVSWGHVLVQGWTNACFAETKFLDGWFGTGAWAKKLGWF